MGTGHTSCTEESADIPFFFSEIEQKKLDKLVCEPGDNSNEQDRIIKGLN